MTIVYVSVASAFVIRQLEILVLSPSCSSCRRTEAMESSSSAVRRRAWINSSRQWLTLEEHDSQRRLCSLPSASTVDDDVFSDGMAAKALQPHAIKVNICSLEGNLEENEELTIIQWKKPHLSAKIWGKTRKNTSYWMKLLLRPFMLLHRVLFHFISS